MDMDLSRIDGTLSWKYVETRHMENEFIQIVSLPPIIGTNGSRFFDIDTVAHAGSLPTGQNLE
jgi:hypothetical protein